MRVVVALHGKTIVLDIDLDKAAAARFQMFAEGNGNRPQQLVGIGGEANAFSKIKQEKRVSLCLFAPGNISNCDVYAQQLAIFVVDGVIAA